MLMTIDGWLDRSNEMMARERAKAKEGRDGMYWMYSKYCTVLCLTQLSLLQGLRVAFA